MAPRSRKSAEAVTPVQQPVPPTAAPVAASAQLSVQALVDVGNQAVLFASVALPADRIESIGVMEGSVAPTYRPLVSMKDTARLHVHAEPGQGSATLTRLCANLSPLMLSTPHVVVAVMFKDRSRAAGSAPVIQAGTPELRARLPVLKPGIAQLAELARLAADSNPVLGRLYTALSQAIRVMENPYVGAFDAVIDGRAEGWVYNTLKPLERVEVVLMEGERPLAYGMADIFRDDLREAKKSDGSVKFSLPVPRRLYDGKPHELHIAVAQGGQRVGAKPRTFEGPNLQVPPISPVIEFEISEKLIAAAAGKLGESARALQFEHIMRKMLVALDTGDTAEARGLLEGLSLRIKGLPLIGLYQGLVELQAKQHEKAVSYLKTVVQSAPDFMWAHVALADAHMAQGQFADAQAAMDAASRLAPKVRPIQARLQKMELDNLLKNVEFLKDASARARALEVCKKAILGDTGNRALTEAYHKIEMAGRSGADVPALMRYESSAAAALRHERIVVEVLLNALTRPTKMRNEPV